MKPNFNFQEQFGHIAFFMPDGGLKYEKNSSEELFSFPETIKESEIEELMEKSLQENKDYIFALVKNNPFELNNAYDY